MTYSTSTRKPLTTAATAILTGALAFGCGGGNEPRGTGRDADVTRDSGPMPGDAGGRDAGDHTGVDAGDNQPMVDGEFCNDGYDDDSDGAVDEGCDCDMGTTQGCWPMNRALRGIGVCTDGAQMCDGDEFGRWLGCDGAVGPDGPSETQCDDGRDEDCDGLTDCSDPDCDAACNACEPVDETCDMTDQDCDGIIDEFPCQECTQIVRVAGDSRYGTAVAQSRMLFPSTAPAVVVIGSNADESDSGPDGVLAGSLAQRLRGPVLLTPREGGIHPATFSEITRLGASQVIILGGMNTVSAQAEADLQAPGRTVERLRGETRADTARAVAARVGAPSRRAFVVNGYTNLVDASLAAGIAGALRYPILYVSSTEVPAETRAALSALNISQSFVIGGEGAVPASVMAQLPGATRIAGNTRMATSRALADRAANDWGVSTVRVSLINAGFPVDAMTAAAAGQIHLYANMSRPIPEETLSFLALHKPREGWLMGGRARFDEGFEGEFCAAVSNN